SLDLAAAPVSLSHSNMSESAKPHHPIPPGKGEKSHAGDFSYVGIDAILEQMRRKAMKQGFELNLMVVGQSGLGKSTLMNTLFKSKVSRNKSVQSGPEERIPKTVEIKSISHGCLEDSPSLSIGFCQFLRPLDVEFMRRLSKVVNIVPVIAKADTLTLEERESFKETIREELRANGIDVYPQKEFDEDAEDRMINDKIREMIPFAVVGSDQEYQVNGKRLLGRKTKWGTIEVENIAHCEFAYLRDLLIRTHMQNIKDITGSIHYETYRVRRLNESNGHVVSEPSDHAPVQPKAQLEEQPGPPQTNGLAAQHEALSHEM
uniref:Septin-9-like n=1 Tax=Cyprinodon variegatus TaxID=28743 RepID=A0A3Q2DM06_CYPVA